METEHVIENSRKTGKKNLDMIVANNLKQQEPDLAQIPT